ncbi:uncharacterized protein LOC144104422 [Amblyomma americanum]
MHLCIAFIELFNLKHKFFSLGLDLVNGLSVEYIPSVLQGVVKQLTDTIMSTSNSAQRFYIGAPSAVSRINARLLTIKPPHGITRLPRAVSERAQWKASEWRHWILFYALRCLDGILHADYWRHLAKLSEALHILLRESITFSEIDKAESLLEHFVIRCHSLYGIGSITFNMHALLHLANCVRSLTFVGPFSLRF